MTTIILRRRGVAMLTFALAAVHCGGEDDSTSDQGSRAGSMSFSGTAGAGAANTAGTGGSAGEAANSGGNAGELASSGGNAGEPSGTAGAAGSAGDDASAGAPAIDDIPTWNGCAAASYADHSAPDDSRDIAIAQDGLVFTPKCMIIAVGQTITFQGSLAAHPLAPGNAGDAGAGSPDSPIERTTSGTSVSFTFSEVGTFPYYCQLHGFGSGSGMSGAVHVRD